MRPLWRCSSAVGRENPNGTARRLRQLHTRRAGAAVPRGMSCPCPCPCPFPCSCPALALPSCPSSPQTQHLGGAGTAACWFSAR